MKRRIKGIVVLLALSMVSTAHAGFFNFGFVNNNGTNLTASPAAAVYTLDFEPGIPGHSAPRGFGSTYYGAGLTHEGDPSVLWSGHPTDVALVMTSVIHDGHAAGSGFSIASGELGGLGDVFVNQVPPTGRVGLNTPLLFLTHDMIHDAQTGDPMDPGYANHAHVYFEADQPGVWDVTFVLRDLNPMPHYGDSDPFTVRFLAVPEPAGAALLALTAGWVAAQRRRPCLRSNTLRIGTRDRAEPARSRHRCWVGVQGA